MTLTICLPLACSALYGGLAPRLSRRLPPAIATWLLSVGGLLAAAASSASLGLLAFLFLAQSRPLAARGRWSDDVLRPHGAVADGIGLVATVCVLVLAARFLRTGARRLLAIRDAYRLAGSLPYHGTELAVVDQPDRLAFAVPGRPGRIVASTGLLRGLDPAQRRAVLAHEHAHLAHHHHLHHGATALAVSVNPLLAGLPAALELSCERWADEDAARRCRRFTVAEALTRAATGSRPADPLLAAAAADLAVRVRALRGPAPRLRPVRLAVPVGLLVATTLATAVALRDVHGLVELAQLAYLNGRR